MIEADLHSHSLASPCGMHTILEMLTAAQKKGVKALAITDHGRAAGGHLTSVFFERVPADLVSGIKLLKGVESNIDGVPGKIDFPDNLIALCDVVLLGLHGSLSGIETATQNTDALIKTIQNNRCVDIITHPNMPQHPVHYKALAEAAKDLGVVLEFNNSKEALSRVSEEDTLALLEACMDTGCQIAVNSDAHVINEVGQDQAVRPILQKVGFPEEMIVNRNLEAALSWLEKRKENKT